MGYQDRDYYREGSAQTQFVTSVVVKLIILNALVFLADVFFGGQEHEITRTLALDADSLQKPFYWWQFFTAGFTHGDIGHIFFNMLGLYVFGKPLEERYGGREFLRFYMIALVTGMVLWAVREYVWSVDVAGAQPVRHILLGASGAVTAVTILFCLLYPRATLLAAFLFPVPAWLVGAIIIAVNVLGLRQASSIEGDHVAYDVHLFGAAFALAYWYFGWNFGQLPGFAELRRMVASPKKWLQPRPALKVHDPEQYYEDLDTEADRILDKLHREGEASLTPQEKRTLEDYSRRMRQKLR
ncbi:MAG TPA: rhomboid family intramembrane serine protease [Pirellulaceae bacterium]|nr:rhomboid family intramembrane serine protease [Pirellulaceae bacterium]